MDQSRTNVMISTLRRVLGLLGRVQPLSTSGDVTWDGPFFIDRGAWWPTRFVLYQHELYCSVQIGWSTPMLVWNRADDSVSFQGHTPFGSGWRDGPELWVPILAQVEARLRSATKDVDAYNARVRRYFPQVSRVGHIRRRYAWPKGSRAPIGRAAARRLARGIEQARAFPSLERLSVERYLAIAGVAYDAAFPDLRALSPREKYSRKADGRHGGMLSLPPRGARAFAEWFESRAWQGCHPWEIVFSHPHGIMLSPVRENGAWRFYLSVDTLGLYAATSEMATALIAGRVPLEVARANEILRALRGEDDVEVGPFYEQLRLDEIEERRPGASALVRWQPLPLLRLARHPVASTALGVELASPQNGCGQQNDTQTPSSQ